ncbi:MAG: TonB-dependent receptor plug domain-containing protein, partial [Ignavibacteria bacterium]|nr:TonB-dependent receptor plug domain-containing protein [Ignavibacteria bacterium]
MKKYFSFIIFIILFTTVLSAQNVTLKGKVVTSRNEPLEGVNVVLLGTNFGDATNSDGFFEIKSVPVGDYTLQASLIGYGKKIYKITKSNYARLIKIFLSEIILQTDQVIVSASKHIQNKIDLSVSTTVISPDILSNRNYQTFDELLRTVAGVQVNLEQVSIRGSSGYTKGAGTRVLVAINGIPFYSGDSGDIVWEIIPVTDIERIEVIKGPASSMYGSSAIGGVINIITKSFAKYPITQFQSYFGMYDKPSYDIWDWSESSRNFFGLALTHS